MISSSFTVSNNDICARSTSSGCFCFALCCVGISGRSRCQITHIRIAPAPLPDNFCPLNDRIRNTCQLCHLNTITAICSAGYDFTKEYNIITFFLHSDTVIIDIWKVFLPALSAHDNVWQTTSWLLRIFGLLMCSTTAHAIAQSVKSYWFPCQSHPGSTDCCLWHSAGYWPLQSFPP